MGCKEGFIPRICLVVVSGQTKNGKGLENGIPYTS